MLAPQETKRVTAIVYGSSHGLGCTQRVEVIPQLQQVNSELSLLQHSPQPPSAAE
jgi:hypothetical protein